MSAEQQSTSNRQPEAVVRRLGQQAAGTFLTANGCVGQSNCAEVAWFPDAEDPEGRSVVLRNNTNPEVALRFSTAAWQNFIGDVIEGAFDQT